MRVPFELLSDVINENIDIEIDGVKYWFYTEDKEERFKDIVTKTIIFESYNKGYFGLDIILTDYGNDLDEDFNSNNELYPVRLHEEITQTFTRK